jgi:hypothetical protein
MIGSLIVISGGKRGICRQIAAKGRYFRPLEMRSIRTCRLTVDELPQRYCEAFACIEVPKGNGGFRREFEGVGAMYAWGGKRGELLGRAWRGCRGFLRSLLRPVPQGTGR